MKQSQIDFLKQLSVYLHNAEFKMPEKPLRLAIQVGKTNRGLPIYYSDVVAHMITSYVSEALIFDKWSKAWEFMENNKNFVQQTAAFIIQL